MTNKQLNIELNDIRAINNANIDLNGITVITGENGCGKSTISKLAYNIIKTSVAYDEIVTLRLVKQLDSYIGALNSLTHEFSYFLFEKDYKYLRGLFNNYYVNVFQLNINKYYDFIINIISKLKRIIENHELKTDFSEQEQRYQKIKSFVISIIEMGNDLENNNLLELLSLLKVNIENKIAYYYNLKDERPLSILNNNINQAFYDAPIPENYNINEYEVPIIDKENEKLMPVHSVQNVAYIDTPMILGMDFPDNRPHWKDLNRILKKRHKRQATNSIDSILHEEIINGNVKIEENAIADKNFVYKRADGKEFDLLECATGLKSFSILQILYKNGFLNDKSMLIIDEPEVHLHPQWVVEYARLLVLLNKNLGVRFLIASHHPDMISAIKYIFEKENEEKDHYKLNFYLAERTEDSFLYDYRSLGTEVDEIFDSFNIALNRIDQYGTND